MDIFDRLYSQKILTDAYKALLNEVAAAPAAPAKPATKPAPTPAKPAPAPNRNPFKIPAPATQPRPQNIDPSKKESEVYVAESFIREAFDDEPTPANREFWRNFSDFRGENVIGKHPVIRQHGEQLARSAYDMTGSNVSQHGLRFPEQHSMAGKLSDKAIHDAFRQILSIERSHREQLEQLAKDITAQIWGEEVRPLLEASLQPPDEETAGGDDEPEQQEDQQEAVAGEHLVQKRVLANMITQGSAMHLMFQAQHLITQNLSTIDERLPGLYAKFAYGSAHQYWLMDLEQMAGNLQGMVVGRAKVDSEPNQDDPEEADFTVKAQGIMFPILVQELCKGVANYLSLAGVAGVSAEELRDLFSKVDNPEDEHYYIQVGHELWRRFLKVKPREVSAAKAVVALHKLDAEEQNRVIRACIENPEEAKRILAELLADPEASADDVLDDAESGNEDWRSSLDDEGEAEASEDDDWGRSESDSEGGLAEPGEEDDKDDDWWR
jgi:hypothetical protein